jgi:hypothetical protein
MKSLSIKALIAPIAETSVPYVAKCGQKSAQVMESSRLSIWRTLP